MKKCDFATHAKKCGRCAGAVAVPLRSRLCPTGVRLVRNFIDHTVNDPNVAGLFVPSLGICKAVPGCFFPREHLGHGHGTNIPDRMAEKILDEATLRAVGRFLKGEKRGEAMS